MSYPHTDVLSSMRKIAADDYFDAVEVTHIEDPQVREEVKALLDGAYAKCREILERDRDKLELVARFLLEHETMNAAQFQLVYDDPAALAAAGGMRES